ncbi:MAG: PAS domain-containing protein [Cyanobacteria bacterium]|nr:PAS domain-containing protein [Cyanobacteriota bacterium]
MTVALLQAAPFGVVLVDEKFRLTRFNRSGRELFRGIDSPIGRDFTEIAPLVWREPFAAEAIERVRDTLATGASFHGHTVWHRVNRDTPESYDWRLERIDLGNRRLGVVSYFFQTTDGLGIEQHRIDELHRANVALAHQLREQREAQERIAGILAQLVTIQEQERQRVAREIHDQLGQPMTALRMHLEAMQGRNDSAPLTEPIDVVSRIAEQLDRSIDFLTWQLRPTVIEVLGLSDALADLVDTWSRQFGVPAKYESGAVDTVCLPSDVETHLYRITQEALQNVHKHARASLVRVRLSISGHQLILGVTDDGRGIQSRDDVYGTPGMGLSNMRDRAVLAGAELFVFWSQDGTTVEVRLPLPAPE